MPSAAVSNPVLHQGFALLQADTAAEGGAFSFWILLLLVSAVFWMVVARSLKKRIDAMEDLPDGPPDQPVSSNDE